MIKASKCCRSDGSGDPEPVLPGEKAFTYISDWSHDGQFLLYQIERSGNTDLSVLRLDGNRKPETFLDSPALEVQGQFSPDGKWMAVDIKATSSSIEPGTPNLLFNTGVTGSPVARMNHYLVTRDRRFLVNRSAEDENSAPITVVLNWNAARQ